MKDCIFCKVGMDALANFVPAKKNGLQIPCRRTIYEDDKCLATLAPEQYSKGHMLVILKEHRDDIASLDLTRSELSDFIVVIHKMARHVKRVLKADRIYVATL